MAHVYIHKCDQIYENVFIVFYFLIHRLYLQATQNPPLLKGD